MKEKLLIFEFALGVLALALSLLWVLNPESNLEPLLVLLGFVITFSEIYRRKSKSQLFEIAEVSDSNQKAAEAIPESDTTENQMLTQSNDTKKGESINHGTITLEQLLEGLNKDRYTGMQISQFVKRTTNVAITCEVLVHNIKEGFSIDDDNSFIMVFSPIAQRERSRPDFITASFPKNSESDLASISSGDSAVISAEIDFIELGGNYSVSLNKAKVLSIQKNA